MVKLKGKNCLITGAASGIGRALALELARDGMNMFLADIDAEGLERTKSEIEKLNVKVFTGACDISKLGDFEILAKAFYSRYNDLDILVNNAGISGGGFVTNIPLEEWKKVLDINLWSIIYSLKVFLPKMIEKGKGHVVNTGSGAGVVGLPCHIHYVASKFAVAGITEALCSELSRKGLKFSVICPTVIKTNIINRSEVVAPPDLLKGVSPAESEEKLKQFKAEFWKRYSEDGLTPEEAAKHYIKGIRKQKLYIFDKKLVPLAMFIKGISRKLYAKVLKREGKDYFELINGVLTNLGVSATN